MLPRAVYAGRRAPKVPENTREFVAMWHTATSEHLAHKVCGVLQELSRRLPGGSAMEASQSGVLSPVLVRAFQVAASPEGGVHAAVHFLAEFAADSAGGGNRPAAGP